MSIPWADFLPPHNSLETLFCHPALVRALIPEESFLRLYVKKKNLFPIGGKRSAHRTPVSQKALYGSTLAESHRTFCICPTICRAVLGLGGSELAQDRVVERVRASTWCSAPLDLASRGSTCSLPSPAASGNCRGRRWTNQVVFILLCISYEFLTRAASISLGRAKAARIYFFSSCMF